AAPISSISAQTVTPRITRPNRNFGPWSVNEAYWICKRIQSDRRFTLSNLCDAVPGDLPPCPVDAKRDLHLGRRQQGTAAIRPLDQPPGRARRKIAEPEVAELERIADAIQIQMDDVAIADAIRLHQRVGRAAHATGDAERSQQTTHQRRLPRAEIATQIDHDAFAIAQRIGQRRAEGLGRGRVGKETLHGFAKCRSAPITSLGNKPRSATVAARSPEIACSRTPQRAASSNARPWASSPAMTPVSTSPMPPAAIPGLPCAQTASRLPRTSVPAPLSATTPPNFSWMLAIDDGRFIWISAELLPSRR